MTITAIEPIEKKVARTSWRRAEAYASLAEHPGVEDAIVAVEDLIRVRRERSG